MKDKDSIFGAEPERLRDLIRAGMDVDDADAQEKPPVNVKVGKIMERPGTRIGGYKLLRVLGEGGMGMVYLAEQEQLIRRRVALKIIKPGMDSNRVLARFESERQALALLDHPNIAQVHDAGTSDSGRPYFVMEFVKGIPITEFCDRHSLNIKQRLRLFQQVCNALQHAHQKGIIHRDIKPSNILVSSENDQIIPKIIDFGVAKAVTQPLTDRTLITEQDQLLGTPEYMSPEQVELASDDIDTRSDIYSLGVLLYELLTGVLPFDSKTLRTGGIENIRKVIRETDPKTPSTRLTKLGDEAKKVAESRRTEVAILARCLHKELEWIPLKAMRKERSERYRSASELSDDIENYLNGNPLIAGPPSTAYRLRKFVRRHKALVTGVAAVLVVLLTGIFVSTIFAIEAHRQRQIAIVERDNARQAERAEQEQREIAENALNESEKNLYVSRINLADRYYLDGKISRVRDLLKDCPEDLRQFEWYYLWRVSDQALMTLRGHEGSVNSVALSHDGSRIISGGEDGTIRIWDYDSGGQIRILTGHTEAVSSVAFSPDGERIVSGSDDMTIRIWDAESGDVLRTLTGHTGAVNSVAFSPDGSRIVSGSADANCIVWNAESGEELMTLEGHSNVVRSVAFNHDGSQIVSVGDGTVMIWDANDYSMLKLLLEYRIGRLDYAKFGPDDSQIAVGGYSEKIRLFDANNYSELTAIEGGGNCISIAFNTDGSQMTAATMSTTIKVWDTVSGSEIITLKGHTDRPMSVTFSSDGNRIVSGSKDGTIKVWDLNSIRDEMTLTGNTAPVSSVAFSPPDGKWIVSSSRDGIRIWDVESHKELRRFEGHQGPDVVLSPDGRRIVSGSYDGTIRILDTESGDVLRTLTGHTGAVNSVAFSPDGSRIVSASFDSTIKIWDAESDEPIRTLTGHEGPVLAAAFSPDGSRIVSGSSDGTIRIWDVENGQVLKILTDHTAAVSSVAFSRDGSRIVSGSHDNTLLVWDANDYSLLFPPLRGHEDLIWVVAFSPDGKRILSGSDDATIKIWDAESGNELITLWGHISSVRSAEFSPDGNRIVSRGLNDGSIKIWDIASPEEVDAELLAEKQGRSWIRSYNSD